MNRNSCSNTRCQAAAATRQRSAARHASPRESLFCDTVDIFNPVGPRIKVRHYHTVPLLWLALLCTGLALGARAQEGQPFTNFVWVTQPVLELSPQSTWENGVGEGFRSSAQSITASAGATYGFAAFGSRQGHDLALVSLTYGHMLGSTMGQDHWYRGNFEGRLELFTGAQFSPSSEWLVGLTPHLRYNFATGTRWIPFVDAGAGVTATIYAMSHLNVRTPTFASTAAAGWESSGRIGLILTPPVTIAWRWPHSRRNLSCAQRASTR